MKRLCSILFFLGAPITTSCASQQTIQQHFDHNGVPLTSLQNPQVLAQHLKRLQETGYLRLDLTPSQKSQLTQEQSDDDMFLRIAQGIFAGIFNTVAGSTTGNGAQVVDGIFKVISTALQAAFTRSPNRSPKNFDTYVPQRAGSLSREDAAAQLRYYQKYHRARPYDRTLAQETE